MEVNFLHQNKNKTEIICSEQASDSDTCQLTSCHTAVRNPRVVFDSAIKFASF